MSAYLFKYVNRTDILFHYNPVMISVIKQVEGVRFDNNQKRWTLPTSNLSKLLEKFKECGIPYVIDVNSNSPVKTNSSVLPSSINIQPRKGLSDITNTQQQDTSRTVRVIKKNDGIIVIRLPIQTEIFHRIKHVEHTRDYEKKEMYINNISELEKVCSENGIILLKSF